jgi:predicted unusual protein kinase regulating ubiquinone biosynthesis (AarF/ABC1/UbiB family)
MKQIKSGGLRRRFAIGAAGARGGLGLLSSKASSLLLPKDQQAAHNEAALQREATRFVKELGELKGAYVKIGQMLALYGEHLLPAAVTEALHTLEAQTTAINWDSIEPSVIQALGNDYAQQIDITDKAFAAASLAQVHRAVFADSSSQLNNSAVGHSPVQADQFICVKIQYPGIAAAIDDDFSNVMQMLSMARWIHSGRQLDALTKELKAHLVREVDYHYERETALKMATLLKGDKRYKVPEYYPELCTDTILTMEFVDGYEVTHPKVQALSQARRNALALSMLELFFKEAFAWGLMQTDPNFGNYRILIDDEGDDDVLVLLDFGAVHELEDSFCISLQKTILAAHQGHINQTIEGLIELNCLREQDSDKVKKSFANFCMFILEPFSADLASLPAQAKTADGLYDWQASRLLKRAGRLGSEGMLVKGFVIPPSEFMLMVRKLTGVFTFVSSLGAKLDSAHLLDPYQ